MNRGGGKTGIWKKKGVERKSQDASKKRGLQRESRKNNAGSERGGGVRPKSVKKKKTPPPKSLESSHPNQLGKKGETQDGRKRV